MIDVGIFSINIHSLCLNYGAALHSFAFQKYLTLQGINSVIVDYKSKHFGDMRLDNPAITYIQRKKPLKTILNAILSTPSFKRKYKAFHTFYEKNCIMCNNNGKAYDYNFFNENANEIHFEFPVIVCESDVIWSPKTSNGFDRVFFCDYSCFNEKVKVAYAPSISNTLLSKYEEKEFRRLISNFDFISAREKQTARYIEKISGKDVPCVLDPVLLFDECDYEPYLEPQNFKNYLLVYNVMKNDKKMIEYAKKVAKKKCLKLVEISDFVRNKIDHKTVTGRSIGEFLWLIKNTSYFITNSFHGVCFAILYRRDFVVFERDYVDLKVKSLLDLLDILDRFIYEKEAEQKVRELRCIDWNDVYTKLNYQRSISKEYIAESIIKSIANLRCDMYRGGGR